MNQCTIFLPLGMDIFPVRKFSELAYFLLFGEHQEQQ